MIRPLAAPRFTPRARAALAAFREAWTGPEPVVLVGLGDPDAGGDEEALDLRFVPAGTPPEPDEFEREDHPMPVRFRAGVGTALEGRIIDFQDGEGGARGFLVRTAGPSGSRAPGPPSPSAPGLVQISGRRSGSTEPAAAPPPEAARSLPDRVRHEIETRVNPLVACHGGRVELERVREDGVAEVVMLGGCQGCAAARGTLADVVSRILIRAVPTLVGVVDVTRHEEGEHPFLARS
jgi:Fe-S cluster biogenesis protein NfuA